VFTGAFADAYSLNHLEPNLVDPEISAELQRRVGTDATVGTCPVTGTEWLIDALGRIGQKICIRGTVPRQDGGTHGAPSGYYL
jgi:hypothetical protein